MNKPTIEVFVDEGESELTVSLVIRGSSIVEYGAEGELAPGCKLSPSLARQLAVALEECAAKIESY